MFSLIVIPSKSGHGYIREQEEWIEQYLSDSRNPFEIRSRVHPGIHLSRHTACDGVVIPSKSGHGYIQDALGRDMSTYGSRNPFEIRSRVHPAGLIALYAAGILGVVIPSKSGHGYILSPPGMGKTAMVKES